MKFQFTAKPPPPRPTGPQRCGKCRTMTVDYYPIKSKRGWSITCKTCFERQVREETRGKPTSERKELSE